MKEVEREEKVGAINVCNKPVAICTYHNVCEEGGAGVE